MITAIQKMSASDQRGFTLVELLIVIAIIAILAAIAIPQFAQYQERAIRASMQSDAKNTATMEEANFGDTQSYASVGTSAAGGAFSVGVQPAKATKGNTVTVVAQAPPANTYVITINNPSAGTGSTNYTMDNSGGMAFVGP